MATMKNKRYLEMAQEYALEFSGCRKVAVGSVIVRGYTVVSFGANSTDEPCRMIGCLREEKFGDNNKTHRNPEDCRAVHSEIDAIAHAAYLGRKTENATIYVTRYPCEACARALVAAGIETVVFGRLTNISLMTKEIFKTAGVKVIWEQEWYADDAVN